MNKALLYFVSSVLTAVPLSAKVSLGFPGEESAAVGIYVKSLSTGKVIANNDENKAIAPASVMKVITAASALSLLEENFRFETNIYTTGDIVDGVCSGNLYIESCADPTIDSELFEKEYEKLASEIARSLQDNGIKTINGDIVINESLSESGCVPQWQIDDVAWAYGAGLFGFNFSDNVFKLWPATGKTVPHIPNLELKVKTASSSDLMRGIDSNMLVAYGPRPNDKKWMVRTSMPNPVEAYKYALKAFLSSKGISVDSKAGKSNATKKKLFTHYSPKLSDIIRETLFESHNMFAEGLLRAIAPGNKRSTAIEDEVNLWKDRGVSTQYNKIVDGSGLARANRLQPIFIADVLEWMAKSGHVSVFASAMPKVGEDGTVKSLLKDSPLKGKLALKSGSMSAVQCFAGYKLDDSGIPTHVVVILVNNFYCSRAALRKSIQDFLLNTF